MKKLFLLCLVSLCAFQASAHAGETTEGTDRQTQLTAVTAWVNTMLDEIEQLLSTRTETDPYALIPLLEEHYPG